MMCSRMTRLTTVLTLAVLAMAAESRAELLFEIEKPNHVAGDLFGRAMASIGDDVLISAPFDDTVGFGAGVVYKYDSTGQLLQTFYNPTPYTGPAGSEYFGRALASVGNSVLVGDPYDSSVVANGGAVHMFDAQSGAHQRTFLNPSGAGSPDGWLEEIEDFGASVAGVGDDKVLIGAWKVKQEGTSYGAAYLYSATTGDLLHTLSAPVLQPFSRFGYSVTAVGNTIAVSQPVFDRPDVGVNASGSVHIFDADTGEFLRTLVDPTPTSNNEQFGYSLAALGDNLLVGGGHGVYMFDPMTGDLLLSAEDPPVYHAKVAAFGDDILVGDEYTGATFSRQDDHIGRALVLDGETGDLLFTIEHPEPDTFNYFGISVAEVGGKIAVGADYSDKYGHHSGAAYMFKVVPEPTSMMLLTTGGLALLLRRRRSTRATRPVPGE